MDDIRHRTDKVGDSGPAPHLLFTHPGNSVNRTFLPHMQCAVQCVQCNGQVTRDNLG